MLNIVLDNDIVLDLLSLSKNDTQHNFIRLQKAPIHFWLPCCTLSVLETQIHAQNHHPLSALVKKNVQWLSSLAAHWYSIPTKCANRTQAMISLDAATLPGMTIIWTNDSDFTSIHSDIEWGDHEFVYGMLAQYENELSLVDLESQQLILRPSLEKQIFNVLKHGQYLAGPEVEKLEKELAAYVNAKHCISVASGTDALLMALMALDIQAGDEVITSVFNFIAAAEVVAVLGAKPVLVDIEPITYTINSSLLSKAITDKTKAIIVPNLFGQCADFEAVNKIAAQHKIKVIEEASQSFGATYHNKPSGTLATIGCTSFSPAKTLGAYGEAGACFTEDDQLADKLRQLRHHGQEKRYYHQWVGINARLDTLQASILLAKLKLFPRELEKQINVAKNYNKLLEGIVTPPMIATYNSSVYSQYTIEVNNRHLIQQKLQQQNIPTVVHYPAPIHLQPAFAYLKQEEKHFPVAEKVAYRVLSLPIHPYLTSEIQTQIVESLKSIL
ncbi:DegT/DnrJ/EryC1/StrS aminotransferase [Beggiatoa sp. PS]|nr:DegT/DnrJ/EryC1/StrS aminotransferase [Beggiatoa sp. PS]